MQHIPASADLQGITELTLVIPVKPGFVDAVGTLTYASRLRLLLKLLGGLRKNLQDVQRFKPFSDTVERIQFIHGFRLNLLGNTKLLLEVSFDGAWEPYMRSIWRDLGPLLDVIMCNCADYPVSVTHSFAEYDRWIRERQAPADFFYIDAATTVSDVSYLRKAERLQREIHDPARREEALATLRVPDVNEDAREVAQRNRGELVRQGLRALDAVHQLRVFYNPDKGITTADSDDTILLRATHMLLKELKDWDTRKIPPALRGLYGTPLAWFEQEPLAPVKPACPRAMAGAIPQSAGINRAQIQGGIVEGYRDLKSGCLLLLQIVDPVNPKAARDGIAKLKVSSGEDKPYKGHLYINLALTFQGLQHLGVPESTLRQLPEEFRQGMETRARLLGDIYENHPDHWVLPTRYRPGEHGAKGEVKLSMVDVVIQIRSTLFSETDMQAVLDDPNHVLHEQMLNWMAASGLKLLHVQALVRRSVGLFGFMDGISQPTLAGESRSRWNDSVSPGEILLGYPTDRDEHYPNCAPVPALLQNGTFLVIRKIRQYVDALNEFLQDQQAQLGEGFSQDDLKARLMGRMPGSDATPLVSPVPAPGSNDFDFGADPDGRLCPLHAHIRRANPRTDKRHDPVPRILRRGMSYGPLAGKSGEPEPDHGLMFMAYNSSIANQFEVIQRWLSGGNSAGGYSGVGDPLLSIPQDGERRTFRCLMGGQVMRFDLDPPDRVRLLTRLQWGLYLFVPSMEVIRSGFGVDNTVPADSEEGAYVEVETPEQKAALLTAEALAEADDRLAQLMLEIRKASLAPLALGRRIVAIASAVRDHQAARAFWKMLLEDPIAKRKKLTAAIWTFIREDRNGAMKTPYGVLVGDDRLMQKVLTDDQTFVVDGISHGLNDSYLHRMGKSIGQIYLGLDDGPAYQAQSTPANAAIGGVGLFDAFCAARTATEVAIAQIRRNAGLHCPLPIQGVVDQVLAALCVLWFDVPDDNLIKRGGQPRSAADMNLYCPFHFTAPSRYFFLPNPERYLAGAGEKIGAGLTRAVEAIVKGWQASGHPPAGALSGALYQAIDDSNELARTLVGVMMGFLPTTLGNILFIFRHWIESALLWRIQDRYLELLKAEAGTARPPANVNAQSFNALLREVLSAMQEDPAPEMIWRMAVKEATLASEKIAAGDKVVLSSYSAICSARQINGMPNVYPAFGGDRLASAPRPVHACPGYQMAMGVLTGICAGVLEVGTLRPTAVPLTLDLHG